MENIENAVRKNTQVFSPEVSSKNQEQLEIKNSNDAFLLSEENSEILSKYNEELQEFIKYKYLSGDRFSKLNRDTIIFQECYSGPKKSSKAICKMLEDTYNIKNTTTNLISIIKKKMKLEYTKRYENSTDITEEQFSNFQKDMIQYSFNKYLNIHKSSFDIIEFLNYNNQNNKKITEQFPEFNENSYIRGDYYRIKDDFDTYRGKDNIVKENNSIEIKIQKYKKIELNNNKETIKKQNQEDETIVRYNEMIERYKEYNSKPGLASFNRFALCAFIAKLKLQLQAEGTLDKYKGAIDDDIWTGNSKRSSLSDISRIKQAKKLCGKCVVRELCLNYAQKNNLRKRGVVYAGKTALDKV